MMRSVQGWIKACSAGDRRMCATRDSGGRFIIQLGRIFGLRGLRKIFDVCGVYLSFGLFILIIITFSCCRFKFCLTSFQLLDRRSA
jgi:hypothetical protein